MDPARNPLRTPGTGNAAFFEEARGGCREAAGNIIRAPAKLSREEIDAVVAYLQARFVGRKKFPSRMSALVQRLNRSGARL